MLAMKEAMKKRGFAVGASFFSGDAALSSLRFSIEGSGPVRLGLNFLGLNRTNLMLRSEWCVAQCCMMQQTVL